MKRLLSVLLCVLLLLALQPVVAESELYEFNAADGIITKYLGEEEKVVVPSEIGGRPVRAIGSDAFGQNTRLKEIILPEGLTHILYNAFYFCENLESVTFPDSLQAIDSYAYFSCAKIENINFPAGFVSLDESAFAFCNLKAVQFTGPLPFISKTAFESGSADAVYTVPEAHLSAYEAALGKSCLIGNERTISTAAAAFEADENGLLTGYQGMNALVEIPEKIDGTVVTAIADRAFFGNPWARVLKISAPIQSIGKSAFFAVPLAQVVLPEGLKDIGEDAFSGAPIEFLVFPGSLTTIGKHAFRSNQLAELSLPEGLTTIGEGAFHSSWKMETAYLPSTVQDIGSQAFFDCDKLSYLVFAGTSLPQIAEDAFRECDSLVDIDIAYNASREDAQAFTKRFEELGLAPGSFYVWRANHPLSPDYPTNAAFTFDEDTQLITSYQGNLEGMTMFFNYWKKDGSSTLNIQGLGEGVFEGSNLKRFYVPHNDAFTTIGNRAFADSGLTEIDLYDSVTEIGNEAFLNCADLKQIVIPASVKRIGEKAFAGCGALQTINIEGEAIEIGDNAFLGCDSIGELVLPGGTVLTGNLGLPAEVLRVSEAASEEQRQALRAALNLPWYLDLLKPGESGQFARMPDAFIPNPENEFEFDRDTGYITKYTGQSERVVIPREIGGQTVLGITYPGFSSLTVQSVAEGAADNLVLTEVVIPETVNFIDDSAFLNCAGLKKVDCYGPITRLGIRSFENCTALLEVNFHNGIKEIDLYAFNFCENLKTIALGKRLEKIGEGAFVGCGLEGLLVIDAADVGQLAFKDNKSVQTIHVKDTVKNLAEGVFQGMSGLDEIYFDSKDAGILGESRFQFDESQSQVKVYVPEDSSEEELAAYVTALNKNLLPGKDMVMRKNFE